jgi:hypothetical protein
VAVVMIGVDPHKGSHTAVAIDQAERVLGQVRVRAAAIQAEHWWPGRQDGPNGSGRLRAPAAWAICLPSSW